MLTMNDIPCAGPRRMTINNIIEGTGRTYPEGLRDGFLSEYLRGAELVNTWPARGGLEVMESHGYACVYGGELRGFE